MDPDDFAAMLEMTNVYKSPVDDIDDSVILYLLPTAHMGYTATHAHADSTRVLATTLVRYSFTDFRAVDPDDFAAMLEMTNVYKSPVDDIDDSVIRSGPQLPLSWIRWLHSRLGQSATVDG